jgi:hypothetical protein
LFWIEFLDERLRQMWRPAGRILSLVYPSREYRAGGWFQDEIYLK